ncbi:cellulose binding domain-containing protein [Thermobifida halotolerans]|uniref:Cellulose binding domain-containing protein n=1 Tax=Thermobifida halotolerans TaxID=483545 RepID=A0A399G121_9ACTN|nr:cellulose binding domain-containing protein [Thermobifida halotolerans]UOE19724.1 cellulose binding domain-containing protein [Thermobifida halotolerans]
MRRHGLGREQRGAHRAEPPGSGPLAAVSHVLGSTVPKRVPPPRPLRVVVVSAVIVGALLFSYSTTQIYLRFAEPEQQAPVPGTTASAAPAPGDPSGDGTGSQAAASTQVEILTEEDTEEETPEEEPPQETGSTGDDPRPSQQGQEGSSGGQQPAPVPQSGSEAPRVSYQKVVYDASHFMGQLTITNTGDHPLDGWELRIGFSDAQVVSAWGTEWEATQNGFVARQPSWEEGIAPGQSATVSFTAEGSSHTPESCSLNGTSCSL